MYAAWIKAEKYVKIEQVLLSPTHREHRVSALTVESIRPFFDKKNMHDSEQRETNFNPA